MSLDDQPIYKKLMRRSLVTPYGCWQWTGAVDRHGYGKSYWCNRTVQVHRVAFVVLGPAFDHALTLDHLCRNIRCWNPDHLEPVTQLVNNRRGLIARHGPGGVTRCRHGHSFSPENTYVRTRPNGRIERECRTCRAAGARAHAA